LTVERTSGRYALVLVVALVGGCTRDATPAAPTPAAGSGSAGCANAPSPGSRSVELWHDGVDRVYDIVVPETARGDPLAVVLGFHGFNESSVEQATTSGLGARALADGFIAIFPQGSDLGGTTPAYFNIETFDDPTLADDVGFTAAILHATEAELCVDPNMVYAMGFSNGGLFAATLGCALGDRIAAVAPVAGGAPVARVRWAPDAGHRDAWHRGSCGPVRR
jgi:polyhydroxybutyrate depolymerase